MISFLFSILDKQLFWNKVYDKLSEKYDDFEMIFVIKDNNPELEDIKTLKQEHKNVAYYTFDENTSENAMINAGIKKVNGECLVLCRDYCSYATVSSDFLVAMGTNGAQIAMFKKEKKQNKIKKYFSNLYHKIISSLFGFDYYEGDIGLIYFGNIALSTLKALPNCTLLTKVNRWKGFDVCYATTDDLPKPTPEKKSKNSVLTSLLISISVFVVLLSSFIILLCFNLLGFLLIISYIMAILLSIFWGFYALLKFNIVNNVGDLKE